jgi:hypothetical protein
MASADNSNLDKMDPVELLNLAKSQVSETIALVIGFL